MTDSVMTLAPAEHTDLTQAQTLHTGGTELVPSVEIERIIALRDGGINKYMAALALLREARTLFSQAAAKDYLYGYDRCVTEALTGTRRTPEKDLEALRRIVDGRIWDRLMTDTGMYTLMSQVQRSEWDRQLEGDSIPDISLDNVLATFRHLSENKAETFAKGLLDVFRRLSWDYKTNNPCRFGKKIVIDRLLVVWRAEHISFNHEGAAKLNDLARPFYILDGKNVPDFRVAEGARFEEHYRANGFEGDQVWEGEYYSVRYYKKGSAHITFKRPELVDRINDIVAQACPGMLPPRV